MAAAQRPFSVTLRTEGTDEALKAFKELPKDASEELRQAALALAETLAAKVAAAGRSEGRQAGKLAGTVEAKRDRVPSITVGGPAKLFRGRKDGTGREAFRLVLGSEFGARGHGFKPHRGAASYWIWKTVEANQAEIDRAWDDAADGIIERFTDGSAG